MASKSGLPSFGKWRLALWPIHRLELRRFLPLLFIYALICFNYSILRATKDALVVTAPQSGAEAIPFIKVWAILPMALLFTYFFTRLSNRYSIKKIFYIMMGVFLSFFFLFSFVLYPYRELLHPNGLADQMQNALPSGFQGLITVFRNWTFTLFYVMSELWGTMIMTVLFWGFANQITSVNAAKRYYAIISLGANVSSILSGQVSVFLSKDIFKYSFFAKGDSWGVCLNLITSSVVVVGLGIVALFWWYTKSLKVEDVDSPIQQGEIHRKTSIKMSMRKNFSYLAKSKYLICIAVIVLTYNISLNMVEVVWKDQIKQLYPNPTDYNAYMGHVMTAMGILSTFIALFLCGNFIRRLGWTKTALITPIITVTTGVLFFAFILLKNTLGGSLAALVGVSPLFLAVLFGTVQNCCSRACKYTLFDVTKEMSFIPLSPESKLKGKAAIDGVGSRLGKSGGSVIHQFLLMVFGSVSLSTPYVGIILLIVIGSWLAATKSLGRQFNELTENHEKISLEEAEEEARKQEPSEPEPAERTSALSTQ